MAESAYNYQVGGSLPVNAPTYVTRLSDEEFYQGLKAGEFCYVLNSRQMGKSSLRVRTMQRLLLEGVACAAIDITAIGTTDITLEQWYAGIVDSLVESFHLYDSFDLDEWWTSQGLISPPQKLSKFIDEILLKTLTSQIVIFIDEIDSTLSLPFSTDDFFALIRDCYNRRADNPEYNRLSFALIGVATPSDLIQDKRRTPFNLGKAIDIKGFQKRQVEPLARGLKEKADNPVLVIAEILNWTGGQPFLTQKVSRLVSNFSFPISGGREKQLIEQIVRERIIKNWESQDEPEHLRTIRDRLTSQQQEQMVSRLLGLYQQILQQGAIEADGSYEQIILRLTGLVVQREGKLGVYNTIYREVFNGEWVKGELDKLRPYSEGISAWLASGKKDESRLLQGEALEKALLWRSGKLLSAEDDEFLNESQKYALKTERDKNEILEAVRKKANRLVRVEVSLGILTATGIITYNIWQKAQIELTATNVKVDAIESQGLWKEGRVFDALLEGLKAAKQLQPISNKSSLTKAEAERQTKIALQQAVYADFKERNRHQKEVWSVSYPNGKIFASGSWDNIIKLWNTITGHEIKTLTGHQDAVRSVIYSPDGKTLASGSDDKTIKLWNTITGHEIKTLTGHQHWVISVNYSPDGKTLASGSYDNTIKLWDTETGKELKTLTGHQDAVRSVNYSPDGKTLASGSDDNTIKLWDTITGHEISTLAGHQDTVWSISFSPDGKILASGSYDNTIKLWDTETGKELKTLTGHQEDVYSVSFSPDGKTLASGSGDNTIKLWDTVTGKELKTLTGHQHWVISVSFSPDSRTLVSGSSDNTIKLWDTVTGKKLKTLTGHQDWVNSVSFSPDGKTLVSGSYDNTIKLWDTTGKEIKTVMGH